MRAFIVPCSLLLAATLTACGDGDDTTGPPASTSISFRGTIAGASESGVFDMTAASPLTGTLTLTGGSVISLTGDFNSQTGALTASGGGYSITATFASGTLSGTFTGPNGPGSMTGLPSDTGTVVLVYCGTGTGTSPGGSVSFVWNVVRSGNNLAGLSVETAGSASPGEGALLNGTISGSTVTLTVTPGGSATGTLSGESMSGTWTAIEGASGTWMGSTSAC